MHNIKWLIFDLDDTLINSTVIYEQALESVGINKGDFTFKRARSEVKETLGEGHVCARNRFLYFKKYLELKNDFSPARLMDMICEYERSLSSLATNQWASLQRKNLLEDLQKKYHLAILTNENTRTQIVKAKAIDPQGSLFKTIITSEEVGYEKPDFKIFNHILERLNSSPSECCMIGDSIENDILPALNLDIPAIYTHEFHTKNVDLEDAYTISSLNDLRDILL